MALTGTLPQLPSGLVGRTSNNPDKSNWGISAHAPDTLPAKKALDITSKYRAASGGLRKAAKIGKVLGYILKNHQRTKIAGIIIKSLSDAVSRSKSLI